MLALPAQTLTFVGQPPVFSFGVIADAQYADLPDGNTEGRCQRYREAPGKLRAALLQLRSYQPPLQLVVHLGDLINGNASGQHLTDQEFDMMASIFDSELGGQLPSAFVVGNHCLSVPRKVLQERLGCPRQCYYTRSLARGWRLIVLDTTEMSGHSAYPADSQQCKEAEEFLALHPLSNANPQMSSWNGGITKQQLSWLKGELAAAEAAADRVIVCSHHQLGSGAARATHLAWNWQEIQGVLLASQAFRLALAGHDHLGGYACIQGRHFVTVEALLEAPPAGNAFAVVHVNQDSILIEGYGDVPSRHLPI